MRTRICCSALFFIAITAMLSFAQDAGRYRIQDVQFDITGTTREFPLSQAVDIDRKRVFDTEDLLKVYVSDIEVRYRNLRVFSSANIETKYGIPDASGVIPVTLLLHTVDTWNLIALPYPKFDSNKGLDFKLKLKNFNFFGGMQLLSADIDYLFGKTNSLGSSLYFSAPFKRFGYAIDWSFAGTLNIPTGEVPALALMTGLDFSRPIEEKDYPNIHFGVQQKFNLNERNGDDVLYEHDTHLFTEIFYVNLPVTLHDFDYYGKLLWTPQVSIATPWAVNGVHDSDLTGPDFTVSHSLSFGRYDWNRNYREGFSTSLSNAYTYNYAKPNQLSIGISGLAAGYMSFFDRVGVTSRLTGFYNFNGGITYNAGTVLRGILDDRINTDSLVSFNIDFPIRVLRINFQEVTGVKWTKAVGFEMHVSPFFDMALSHDPITGRYYSFKDGWYAGGLEVIVYPMKMRSIFARASMGWDLEEVIRKGGKLTGNSARDGESIHELSIGIGLFY